MTGTIPNELGLLTKLNWLTLAFNQLTGTVPTSLASLPLLSTSTLAPLFLYYFGTTVVFLTSVHPFIQSCPSLVMT
jgi:hypothetical protein